MHRRIFRRAAVWLVIFGVAALAACGQKGDLYLPDDAQQTRLTSSSR
jgi:predicted small lipoprotein YifL